MANKTKVVQVSANGGEISEIMTGRIDDVKYQSGLRVCKNFLCRPQGPVENRPGFAYVTEVKDSTKPVRLIPFAFNNNQTCVVELGDKYARFHTQGKTILGDDGQPYEIVTPWAAKDVFDLHYAQSADIITFAHPNYAPTELRRHGMTNWKVATVNPADMLDKPTNPTAVRHQEAADDPNKEKYKFKYAITALSKDKLRESLPAYTDEVVANLYAYGTTVKISCDVVEGAVYYRFYKNVGGLYGYIGDSTEPSIIDDDIDADMSVTPPLLDDVFQMSAGISSVEVTNGGSGYVPAEGKLVLKRYDLRDKNICRSESSDFGYPSYPKLPVVVYDQEGSGATVVPTYEYERDHENHDSGEESRDTYTSTTKLVAIEITSSGRDYIKPRLRHESKDGWQFPSGVHWDESRFDIIPLDIVPSGVNVAVTDPNGYGAELEAIVQGGAITAINIIKGGQGYIDPKIRIDSPVGTGATATASIGKVGNFPSAIGYFDQRRIFAGLAQDPQRIIMTRTGTDSDFTYSLPTRDDDRISYQIATQRFDEIRHVIPLSHLILMTSGSEVRVSPINSDALTPSSFSARPQSFIGATNVQPVIANNNVIYCAARGGHIRELSYQYQAGGYLSGDISLRAAHLFDGKEIRDITLQQAPYPIVWFVSSSGDLLGLTYVPDQSVGAWHHHTTDGVFESCAAVAEGAEDALYCVIRRTINGADRRFVERMATRAVERVEYGFFVDCGGTYNGAPTRTISGLNWLEGKTVSILADGSVHPRRIVKDGKIELDAEASLVHVGLPIDAEIETLPLALQMPGYGSGTQKNLTRAFLRFIKSRGGAISPSIRDMVDWKQRKREPAGTPILLATEDETIKLAPKFQSGGTVRIRQDDPIPMTIASLGLEVEVEG